MGECPVWEERENALVYVDINSQKVCRWSPVTNEVQSVSVGKSPYSLLHPGSLLCLSHPSLLVGVLQVGGLSYFPWGLSSHDVLLSTVWPKPAEQRGPCTCCSHKRK